MEGVDPGDSQRAGVGVAGGVELRPQKPLPRLRLFLPLWQLCVEGRDEFSRSQEFSSVGRQDPPQPPPAPPPAGLASSSPDSCAASTAACCPSRMRERQVVECAHPGS